MLESTSSSSLDAIAGSPNLIRTLLEQLRAINPSSPAGSSSSSSSALLDLSLGDPTAFGGSFGPFPGFMTALMECAPASAGYAPAIGLPSAKQALAMHKYGHTGCHADDVIITAGCSMALDMALRCLVESNSSSSSSSDVVVLVPAPGFPLYETLLRANRIKYLRYELVQSDGWRVDCQALSQLGEGAEVKAILVCNPSNPTGSVYDEQHLCDIVSAIKTSFPQAVLLADQIYEDVVFGQETKMHDLGPISRAAKVPCITISGLSKGYHCPGWRMGWMVLYDNAAAPVLTAFRQRVHNLASMNMGASTGIQNAVARCVTTSHDDFIRFRSTANAMLGESASIFCDALQHAKGGGVDLCPPSGAMYLFFRFRGTPACSSSLAICRQLATKQRLLVLPGDECFHAPAGYLRVFIAIPSDVAREAVARLLRFADEEF